MNWFNRILCRVLGHAWRKARKAERMDPLYTSMLHPDTNQLRVCVRCGASRWAKARKGRA